MERPRRARVPVLRSAGDQRRRRPTAAPAPTWSSPRSPSRSRTPINGIAGIRTLTSSSGSGRASLRVEFELGSDLEAAANDVRDRVNGARNQLPPDIDPPAVSKADADAQTLIMLWVKSEHAATWSSSRASPTSCWSSGCRPSPAWPRSTSGARRSPPCGSGSIRSGSPPTGSRRSTCATRSSARTWSCRRAASRARAVQLAVRTLSRPQRRPEEFEDLVVKRSTGRVVRLGDVGRAELAGQEPQHHHARTRASPWSPRWCAPQPGANNLAIVERVLQAPRPHREGRCRPDIKHRLGFDTTHYIRRSIEEVEQTIFIALGAGGRRHLPVPARLAHHPHPGARHPGVADRRLLRHVRRPASRSTCSPCSRWCSRSAWWSTTPSWCSRTSTPRSSRACARSRRRSRGTRGDLLRGHRDHPGAGRRVPAASIFLAGSPAACSASSAWWWRARSAISAFVALTLTPMLCEPPAQAPGAARPRSTAWTEPFFQRHEAATAPPWTRFLGRRWLVCPIVLAAAR